MPVSVLGWEDIYRNQKSLLHGAPFLKQEIQMSQMFGILASLNGKGVSEADGE